MQSYTIGLKTLLTVPRFFLLHAPAFWSGIMPFMLDIVEFLRSKQSLAELSYDISWGRGLLPLNPWAW